MIRIGTRGSALARWQAEHVAEQLRRLGHSVSIEILVTAGDRVQTAPFAQVGNKGIFTKEIEDALQQGRIDIAVHSLKDLASELPAHFVIGCIPPRADPRDAFVSVGHASFAALPSSAVVGTSSIRRQALLRNLRPDLDISELRGNVDTRLRKLEAGQYDAIVLAAAGLDRLGMATFLRERFPAEQMCPAAGQGALAVECRADDRPARAAVAALDDAATRFAVTLERSALAALEGGCQVPIGVYCESHNSGWRVRGVVAQPDGSQVIREQMKLSADLCSDAEAREAGQLLAALLLNKGAGELLRSVAPLPARGNSGE